MDAVRTRINRPAIKECVAYKVNVLQAKCNRVAHRYYFYTMQNTDLIVCAHVPMYLCKRTFY